MDCRTPSFSTTHRQLVNACLSSFSTKASQVVVFHVWFDIHCGAVLTFCETVLDSINRVTGRFIMVWFMTQCGGVNFHAAKICKLRFVLEVVW